VAGIVRQAFEQRFHGIRIATGVSHVPQGQSHALGPGMLAGMGAQRERDVVHPAGGGVPLGRDLLLLRPRLAELLADGADPRGRSVAVAVAAIVGPVARLLQLRPCLGYVLICRRLGYEIFY